jgi:DNA polymerase-3 subunit delta
MTFFLPPMLPDSTQKTLQAIYLVSSDEPLLLRDWLDQSRKTLLGQGFEEIVSYQVEQGLDWDSLMQDGQSMSLFSQRQCLIVRFNSSKPGQQGARFIQHITRQPGDDLVYILVMPKLDAAVKSSAWLKAIKKVGEVIELKPVYPNQRADWILQRAAAKGVSLDRQAAMVLADLTEGNLLATDQELEKLALTTRPGVMIDYAEINQRIEHSARYTQYLLVDACLEGKIKRAVKILRGLREEGMQPVQFLYSLQQALEALMQLKLAQRDHALSADTWKALRIWPAKQRLYSQALSRLGLPDIERLLVQCAKLDRLNKGQQRDAFDGDDWLALHILVAELAGVRQTEYQQALMK